VRRRTRRRCNNSRSSQCGSYAEERCARPPRRTKSCGTVNEAYARSSVNVVDAHTLEHLNPLPCRLSLIQGMHPHASPGRKAREMLSAGWASSILLVSSGCVPSWVGSVRKGVFTTRKEARSQHLHGNPEKGFPNPPAPLVWRQSRLPPTRSMGTYLHGNLHGNPERGSLPPFWPHTTTPTPLASPSGELRDCTFPHHTRSLRSRPLALGLAKPKCKTGGSHATRSAPARRA